MVIFERKTNNRFFDFQIDFLFRISKIKKGFAIGTYSICNDGKHIIYLDYDNFRFEWLIDELNYLRQRYKLSNFYIFRSSKVGGGKYKHHCVCFDKVTARVYNEIVMESNADMLFKNNGFFDFENARVLRFSSKTKSSIGMPYYHGFLESKYNNKQKSRGHINFYRKMFDIPEEHINLKNIDNSEGLRIISYATRNI